MRAFKKRLLTLLAALVLLPSLGVAGSLRAAADDAVISKVLTTLSSTPVALVDPALITVATSTPGCYIISAGWFDANGNAVSGAFNTETYRLEINVGANDGYVIDRDVACYLNNSAVNCAVASNGKSVTITREYSADVWAPTIYKNPGAETVDEGGWASFVVSGSYVRDYEWALVDPTDRITIPVSQLKDTYRNMDSSGDGSPKLILYHIPYELNGWKVVCNFIGAGTGNVTRSQPALLTVNPDPSRATPTPSPTPSASPIPSPEVSSVPAEASPSPEVHEHHFSDTWHYDALGHWRECPDDGAVADEGRHSFTWTQIQPESETEAGIDEGVCEVCGYVTRRSFGGPVVSEDAEDGQKGSRLFDLSAVQAPTPLMAVLLALIPADVVLLFVHLRNERQRRRRKRRR